MKKQRWCCAVDCDKQAEFEIYDCNDRRDVGVTESCEEHLGSMLGISSLVVEVD
jgi:hypothetical protein